MSLRITENQRKNILELEVSGKFAASDFEGLEASFQKLKEEHGKIRVLLSMRDFHGWKGDALWDEVRFDLKHFREIERLALVGDAKWEKFLGVFARPFTDAEVRYFDQPDLAAAREWLEG